MVAYGRLKTKENFKLLALKVVAVAYERWSLTRGSKYSDMTWKVGVLEHWSVRRGCRLREVVATGGSNGTGSLVQHVTVNQPCSQGL